MIDGATTTSATATTTTFLEVPLQMIPLPTGTSSTTAGNCEVMAHYPTTTEVPELWLGDLASENCHTGSGLDSTDDFSDGSSDESSNLETLRTLRTSDDKTLRLPSGKLISQRPTTGPRASRRGPRRAPSPATATSTWQKRLSGNCAMVSSGSSAASVRSSQDRAVRGSSRRETSEPKEALPTQGVLSLHHLTRPTTRQITVRRSDAQTLAGLPMAAQHALLSTHQKAVSKADRAERRFQGKMGSAGNLKMKEHFVIDVPFGPGHRCRF